MKSLFTCFLAILFIVSSTSGQDQHLIDSLRHKARNISNDSDQYELYAQLCGLWFNTNADTAATYAQMAYQVSLKLSPHKQASALSNLSETYRTQGKFDESIQLATKGIKLIEGNDDLVLYADLQKVIANAYSGKGDLNKAASLFYEVVKKYEAAKEYDKLGNALSAVGSLHSDLHHYEQAISFHEQALELALKHSSPNDIAGCYNNLASSYVDSKDYDKALFYYEKCLSIVEKTQMVFGIAITDINIGAVYGHKRDWNKALEYYLEGLALQEQMGYKPGIAQTNGSIGVAYGALHQPEKALKHLKKSYQMAKELQSLDLMEFAGGRLARAYYNMGMYKKSFEQYDEFFLLYDSLRSVASQKQIAELSTQYGLEKKEDSLRIARQRFTLEKLEKDRVEKESAIKDQILLIGGITGVLLIILSLVALKSSRERKKANVALTSLNEKITEQNKVVENQKLIVEEKNKEIVDSINYALRIQQAILPPKKVVRSNLENSFILYKPKDIVAGDFYWMETVDNRIFFAAADCTGHGVPGAMVSVICANALTKSLVEEKITDPGKMLDRTRELVIDRFGRSEEDIKDGMDIALVALEQGKNNSGEQLLKYAGANNPLWIIRNGANEVEEIKADKQPIGMYAASSPFTTHEIKLNTGDSIYIFSDGYPDQFGGERGKKYKSGKMKQLLLSIQDNDLQIQRELLNEEFESWKGDLEQIDDVCVIGVRV